MTAVAKEETFSSLLQLYKESGKLLNWPSIFVLPSWLGTWWSVFGSDYQLSLFSLWQDEELIGIAPLMQKDDAVYLLGSADVCDYLDFITAAGRESLFLELLFSELKSAGVRQVILNAQRPDALVFKEYFASAKKWPYRGQFTVEDQSYELELPASWDDYLGDLNKKQRHEVRRKLRRLEESVQSYRYRVIEKREEIEGFMPQFLELFKENPEKAGFLTAEMTQYFQLLIPALAGAGLARFGLLEIDDLPAAAVLYFAYRDRIYLYNSGYHSGYSSLSAGLLSKILCIRESIDKGRKVFDFLKGNEVYKSRLGGTAIPIYKVSITI